MTTTVRLADVRRVAPRGWSMSVAEPPPHAPLPDPVAAVRDAVRRPVAGPDLRSLAADALRLAGDARRPPRVVIAVTDSTRDCPDDRFVPAMLDELAAAGVAPADVTIVVATGLHRPSTDAEKRAKLGDAVVDSLTVVDHDALDARGLVDLGSVADGIEAVVSRRAVEADLLLATGVVEPHQYAGWSGGGKTVAIGLAGEATISATHGIAMLDDPRVRLVRTEGNPFAAAVTAITALAGLRFVVNAVLDAAGRIVAVAAGEPGRVHAHLVATAGGIVTAPIHGRADVVVVGVPSEKAANLYQASRGVTYLHYAPTPIARPGGVYVLAAPIPEGVGQGTGERRCAEALRGAAADGLDTFLERIRREGTRGGEQRAYLIATVLRDARIVVAGAREPDAVRSCGLLAEASLGDALALADSIVRAPGGPAHGRGGPIEALVVPDAIRTLPIVIEAEAARG